MRIKPKGNKLFKYAYLLGLDNINIAYYYTSC